MASWHHGVEMADTDWTDGMEMAVKMDGSMNPRLTVMFVHMFVRVCEA
jgi:hypothetical protein